MGPGFDFAVEQGLGEHELEDSLHAVVKVLRYCGWQEYFGCEWEAEAAELFELGLRRARTERIVTLADEIEVAGLGQIKTKLLC